MRYPLRPCAYGRRAVTAAIRVSTGQHAHGSAKCVANTGLSEATEAAITVSAVCRAHRAKGSPDHHHMP
jgi:hypothetical protein